MRVYGMRRHARPALGEHMNGCNAVGNLQSLRMKRENGYTIFSGDLQLVEFFGNDDLPSFGAGEVAVYGEDISREKIQSGSHPRSCIWVASFEFKRQQMYHVSVQLNDDEFAVFCRMAEKHLGGDVAFTFSFEFGDMGEDGLPTKKDFIKGGGNNIVVRDPKLQTIFSPGPLIRPYTDKFRS